MTNKEIIHEWNRRIQDIYEKENLYPLRGKDNSYKLNGKQILMWHHEITRPARCQKNIKFDYHENLDDILYISDEIVYFTAHLFLYKPFINTPIRDAYEAGDGMVYPFFMNIEGKRYGMFLNVVFEKVYNYWDRIGDLIASYFPDIFSGNIYFAKTISELESEYADNENYRWLLNFKESDFRDFNDDRINIVHYVSKSTEHMMTQISQSADYEKSNELSEKILSYTDYFKGMNKLCKEGLENTLKFLSEVNNRKGYKCD